MAETLLLQHVDSVPLQGIETFTFEFQRWLSTLVDSLNTTIGQIESILVSPQPITGTTQAGYVNTYYIPTDVTQTAITLPEFAPVGSRVGVAGMGAGGWSLNLFAGQTIELAATTASVSVESAERYDAIEVMCVVANTTWVALSSSTTGFIIT